jgi:hypothetical protein
MRDMLRITTVKGGDPGARQLVLEGRVVGPWIPELRNAVYAENPAQVPVYLDLAGVHFIDPDGLQCLHDLRAQGIHLQNCSPFVRDLLNTAVKD